MKLIDYVVIFIMLCSLSYITYYYITENINECTANPMVFGVNNLVEDYGFYSLDCSCNYGKNYFNFNQTGFYIQPKEKNYTEKFYENLTNLFDGVEFIN